MMCATDVAARGLDVKDVSKKAAWMVEPIEKGGRVFQGIVMIQGPETCNVRIYTLRRFPKTANICFRSKKAFRMPKAWNMPPHVFQSRKLEMLEEVRTSLWAFHMLS